MTEIETTDWDYAFPVDKRHRRGISFSITPQRLTMKFDRAKMKENRLTIFLTYLFMLSFGTGWFAQGPYAGYLMREHLGSPFMFGWAVGWLVPTAALFIIIQVTRLFLSMGRGSRVYAEESQLHISSNDAPVRAIPINVIGTVYWEQTAAGKHDRFRVYLMMEDIEIEVVDDGLDEATAISLTENIGVLRDNVHNEPKLPPFKSEPFLSREGFIEVFGYEEAVRRNLIEP